MDRAVIIGNIGVETIYGRYIGNFQLLDALPHSPSTIRRAPICFAANSKTCF